MKKKYLIFGATGSIGSSLANKMYDEKYDCHLIGRNEEELKKISNKLSYSYSVCDVLKLNFADQLFKDLGDSFNFEQSMHAWHPMPNTTVENDQKSFAEFLYSYLFPGP